jgi:hypothetical protein
MTDSRLSFGCRFREIAGVIAKIPFDELLDTLLKFIARSIAHVARQGVDVRRGIQSRR